MRCQLAINSNVLPFSVNVWFDCVSSKEALCLYLCVYCSGRGQSATPVWITWCIFVHSAHHTHQNLSFAFLSLLVGWIVVSIYREVIHQWCNISGVNKNRFHLGCWCFALFLTTHHAGIDMYADRGPLHKKTVQPVKIRLLLTLTVFQPGETISKWKEQIKKFEAILL